MGILWQQRQPTAKLHLQHGAAAALILQKAHAAYGPYFAVLRKPPQCCSLAAAVPDHSWGMEAPSWSQMTVRNLSEILMGVAHCNSIVEQLPHQLP